MEVVIQLMPNLSYMGWAPGPEYISHDATWRPFRPTGMIHQESHMAAGAYWVISLLESTLAHIEMNVAVYTAE